MLLRGTQGNVLPLMLVLMGSMLLIYTVLLETSQGRLERSQVQARHQRLHTLVFHQAEWLRGFMEKQLEAGSGTSALLSQSTVKPERFSSFWLQKEKTPYPLHSVSNPDDSTVFQRLDGHSFLHGDWIPLVEHDRNGDLAIAWAFEDLGLEGTRAPPPHWPLPTLSPSISSTQAEKSAFQNLWKSVTWNAPELWNGHTEPLVFTPSFAPALIPVLESVALRFSIFASGPARSREKIIRMRYFIEGVLWNPYNRDMQLHSGSTTRPAFHMSIEGLPRVRVHNLSRGIRSGWIDLDRATNVQSEATGISAWIDMPATIRAGESLSFTAPLPERQGEGLARTLHRGFLVGPADRIRLEFDLSGPIRARATALRDESHPGEERSQTEWASLEATCEWPEITFARADGGDRPFYLPDGSLSFSHDKAYAVFEMRPLISRYEAAVDPRLQITSPKGRSAHQRTGYVIDLREVDSTGLPSPPPFALFSWPVKAPTHLLAATDLPWFDGGYRAGWPYSDRNDLLNDPAAWIRSPEIALLPPPDKDWAPYWPALPINSIDKVAWMDALTASGKRSDGFWTYPAFATVNTNEKRDFATLSDERLRLAGEVLANHAKQDPVASIADFFHQNRPLSALGLTDSRPGSETFYTPLNLPLNALFRSGPKPARHSAAWLLHIAARHREAESATYKSARFWLLHVIDGTTRESTLTLIHAEWLDRHSQLLYPSQSPTDPNDPDPGNEPPPRPA